jgi:hypothetical protein
MESLTCPKCNYLREPRAVDCPACGIVFAKYEKAAAQPAALRPAPQALLNPYAAPQSDNLPPPLPVPQEAAAAVPSGVWRHAGLLVIQAGAELPGRCVVCNRSTVHRWPKTFYWMPPGLRLLIVMGPLIYIIVALAVRKKADLAVPLCEEHEGKRRDQVRNSWLLAIAGVILMVLSFLALGDESSAGTFTIVFFLGVISLIASVLASSRSLPLQPTKIDSYYSFMRKAGDDFLRSLPSAPMGIGM